MTRSRRSLENSIYENDVASPGFLFWKTFNAWSRSIRHELERIDLTQVQYSILAAVSYLASTGEPISQQDVSNQLSMDKMMVSDVVKTLEKKKLLLRREHPSDGRSVSLHLTPEARRLLRLATPIVESADERFFGALNAKERAAFTMSLISLLKDR